MNGVDITFRILDPHRCRCRQDATRSAYIPQNLNRHTTRNRHTKGQRSTRLHSRCVARTTERLTAELRARLNDNKPELLELLGFVDEYRALIRNAFAVMVHHASARAGLRAFAEDQARLTDELGPVLTAVIRDSEARQWRRDTGLCPVCGDDDDCDMCRDAHEAGAAD